MQTRGQECRRQSQNSASHTIKAPNRVHYKYMKAQRAQISLWLCQAGTTFLLPCTIWSWWESWRRKAASMRREGQVTALLPVPPPTGAGCVYMCVWGGVVSGRGWIGDSQLWLWPRSFLLPKNAESEECLSLSRKGGKPPWETNKWKCFLIKPWVLLGQLQGL